MPADVDALFRERKDDALAFFASIAETRDVVGSPKAYDLLHPLLFKLVDKRNVDVEPLVSLLSRIVAFEKYNPGGNFQYEAVRNDALRLLARHGDTAARATIDRFVAGFPANRNRSDGPALVQVLAEAAIDLGAPELAPDFKALLATMLLDYTPAQRKAALAEAEAVVAKLARVRNGGGHEANEDREAAAGREVSDVRDVHEVREKREAAAGREVS